MSAEQDTTEQWFTEKHAHSGSSIGFRITERLHSEKTPFQTIEIYDSTDWGKLMVIDGRLVIAGSLNYTGPATTLNDENILVLGDLEETKPDAEAAQRRLAAYALEEIERIIADLSRKV